jgi:hypothetical protein
MPQILIELDEYNELVAIKKAMKEQKIYICVCNQLVTNLKGFGFVDGTQITILSENGNQTVLEIKNELDKITDLYRKAIDYCEKLIEQNHELKEKRKWWKRIF